MNFGDANYLGPAITLFAGAGVVLGADVFTDRRAPARTLALLTILAAALCAVAQAMWGPTEVGYGGIIRSDAFSSFFTFLLLAITAAVLTASGGGLQRVAQAGEFYALVLVSTASMVVLAQAQELITIFVAIETTSVCQFILAGLARDDRSAEAGLKYLLTGAVSAAVLLYGFAFLFGLAGSTNLEDIATVIAGAPEGGRLAIIAAFVMVAAGLGFKMALVPFQAWVPDVYQGAPTPVTTFLSAASKAAGFAVTLRIFYTGLGGGDSFVATQWAMMFALFAAVSMTFGNLAAIQQTNVKRLLGYSSIAQAGNIAVGLAAVASGSTLGPSAVLFFLGTYAATNVGAFICVIVVSSRVGSDDLRDYAGLLKRSPGVALVLSLCLLSLTGIPPTAGFLAKLYVFNAAVQTGHVWMVALVIVGVLNTAISAFYYLRWARIMLLDEPREATTFMPSGTVGGLLTLAALAVLFFGVNPTPLIDIARRAAATLL
ncbi:MAG: NADH-quinone oxidoreductase subunit N [Dehalococcoidia bacterium]